MDRFGCFIMRQGWTAGYSLVELMISIGIGAGLMLALGSSLVQNQTAVRTIENRLELADFKVRVSTLLSNGRSCSNNFVGVNPNTTANINQLRQTDSLGVTVPRFSVGDRIGGKFTITRMTRMSPGGAAVGANTSGVLNLRIFVRNISSEGKTFGTTEQYIDVPIGFTTRDTLPVAIENCDAQAPEGLSCRTINGASNGTSVTVNCPAGYKVTGGGFRDTEGSKTTQHTVPMFPTVANPWGGWRCFNDDGGGTLSCSVICCR